MFQQYEQFIKIRHDIKNHSLCLAQLLEKENVEEARHYLEQWNTVIEKGEAVIQTGSVFADALLIVLMDGRLMSIFLINYFQKE